MHNLTVGQEYRRGGSTFELTDLTASSAVLRRVVRYKPFGLGAVYHTVELDRSAFEDEISEGEAVLRPECPGCGFNLDPDDEAWNGEICDDCWWQQATVAERVEREASDEPYHGFNVAAEAQHSDNPTEFLLEVLGDPARSSFDREEADLILAGAVETKRRLDAMVRCPECYEGESFEMVPETGEVRCWCGHQMKPPEAEA